MPPRHVFYAFRDTVNRLRYTSFDTFFTPRHLMDLVVSRVSCCRHANVPTLRGLSAMIAQCTPTKLAAITATRIINKPCGEGTASRPWQLHDERSNSSPRWNFTTATMNDSPNLTVRWTTVVSRTQTIHTKFVESGTHYKTCNGELSNQHCNGVINRQSRSIMRFSPRKLFSQFRLTSALVLLTICQNLLCPFVHQVIAL
jgi:hypothetical protein